jgi:hypothetical protein
MGAISAGIGESFGPIGARGWGNEVGRAVAHGFVGGVYSMAMGGEFSHGFLAGFVGSMGGSLAPHLKMGQPGDWSKPGLVAARTAFSAVVGGTASAMGGGKFANGAWTAAFQHLMNAERLHSEPKVGDTRVKNAAIRVNGRGMGPGSKFYEGKAAILEFAAAGEHALSPFSLTGGVPNNAGDIAERVESVQLVLDSVKTSVNPGGDVTEVARHYLEQAEQMFNKIGPFEAYTIVQTETYQPVPRFIFFTQNKWVASPAVVTKVRGDIIGGFASPASAASAAAGALKNQLSQIK